MTHAIDRDALLDALRHVASIVENRNVVPIVGHVLIEIGADGWTITGTDLNLHASARVAGDPGELAITVPADRLVAAVSSLRPGAIGFALEASAGLGQMAVLTQGRSSRKLATLPAADFPQFRPPEDAARFTLPAAALLRLLDVASVAVGSDNARPYLEGVFLHARPEGLFAAATNGNILVRASARVPDGAAEMPDMIVPAKAVNLVRRLIGAKPAGDVTIEADARRIGLTIGQASVQAKLIDGSYPDYTRVIPAEGDKAVTAQRDALIGAVKAVAAVSSEKTRGIKVTLGEEAELSVTDPEGAAAVEPLDGDCAGGAIEFGINAAYLQAIAGIFGEASRVRLGLTTPQTAVLITAEAEPDLIAVIMPMRV